MRTTLDLLDQTRFSVGAVSGHQQISDVYLLGLAVKRRGVLATFDRRLPVAVKGTTGEHVELLALAE